MTATLFTKQDVWFQFEENGAIIIYFGKNVLKLSLKETKQLQKELNEKLGIPKFIHWVDD